MACILKIPNDSKGVMSFTSNEYRELIRGTAGSYVASQKDKWVYLLHHNWQPCHHISFFDASLCNPTDLLNTGPCLDMDCCNFAPEIFNPGTSERDIDVIFVTRATDFKRIPVFYSICKKLMEIKPEIRIVLICSVDENSKPKDPKQLYLDTFTREERKRFVPLFFDYDAPFSVDKHFMAHFYKTSKVFVHTANGERHSRVCSYAWSSGIPVVGHGNLALFLPKQFRAQPYFYESNSDDLYVPQILKALKRSKNPMPYDEIKYHVNEVYSIHTFADRISKIPGSEGHVFTVDELYGRNLDIRMGRHCEISVGENSLKSSIPELMEAAIKHAHAIPKDTYDFELDAIRLENG